MTRHDFFNYFDDFLRFSVSFRPPCVVTSVRHGEFGANTLK